MHVSWEQREFPVRQRVFRVYFRISEWISSIWLRLLNAWRSLNISLYIRTNVMMSSLLAVISKSNPESAMLAFPWRPLALIFTPNLPLIDPFIELRIHRACDYKLLPVEFVSPKVRELQYLYTPRPYLSCMSTVTHSRLSLFLNLLCLHVYKDYGSPSWESIRFANQSIAAVVIFVSYVHFLQPRVFEWDM